MNPGPNETPKDVPAVEYIGANFHPSDRIALLLRSGNTGQTIQRIATAERIAAPPAQDWLQYKNEKESCDIYIGMNTLKPQARTRTKEDIQTIRHLYLDIDHDGLAALTRIRQSNLVPTPNYTINTSPEMFQVVWRVEGIEQEQAEGLLRAMARKFGGDPAATDSTRVLRLPGFLNRKYDAEFRVRAERHSDRVYHLSDFRLRAEPIDNDLRAQYRLPAHRSSDPRPLSQSERDWIYAKRALARGDDPEEVVRRLADFRSSEKSNPEYYARLTVKKAQAELAAAKERTTQDTTAALPEPDMPARTG